MPTKSKSQQAVEAGARYHQYFREEVFTRTCQEVLAAFLATPTGQQLGGSGAADLAVDAVERLFWRLDRLFPQKNSTPETSE